MLLQDLLVPLENNHSSEEYSKLWKRLHESVRDLDKFYERSKDAIFRFKKLHNDIRNAENLNDALRHVYYDALTNKKKYETDRDSYFECDKELAHMKNQFVNESQDLALRVSKYIEYNQRFAFKREELFSYVLEDFGKVTDQNSSLNLEKERMKKELMENKSNVLKLTEKVKELDSNCKKAEEKCKCLEDKRDFFKKETEWTQRQNAKLKETQNRLEDELREAKKKVQELEDNVTTQKLTEHQIHRESTELLIRYTQLQDVVSSQGEQLAKLKSETQIEIEARQGEANKVKAQLKEAKERLQATKENNRKILTSNQQLREKLSAANHKMDKVIRDKLKSVLKEYRTRKSNEEMAIDQLRLIDEVLELKSDFFRDKTRIRQGAKLNRKLETDVQLLQEKVRRLKESSLKIDPLLVGAKEYRKQVLRKYGARKSIQTSYHTDSVNLS